MFQTGNIILFIFIVRNGGLFCAGKQASAKVLQNYWELPANHRIIDIPLRGFVCTSAYSAPFSLIAVGLRNSVFFINTQVNAHII